jgi:hypothetical protein
MFGEASLGHSGDEQSRTRRQDNRLARLTDRPSLNRAAPWAHNGDRMVDRPSSARSDREWGPGRVCSGPPHSDGASRSGPSRAGSPCDWDAISGRCQSVRRRNQPMPSAIQKVTMGVSTTAATTNQNCVSGRLRIGMMSHVEDALTRHRLKCRWRRPITRPMPE